MKKLLTILAVLFCFSASAQTTVYDTTVVRTPLTVAVGAGAIYDTLYMAPATTSVNGYMTAASMTNIANLQSDMTTANSNIASLQASVNSLGGYVTTNSQAGTTYTLQSSDHAALVNMTNAAASTITIPTGLSTGFTCRIMQSGGTTTVAGAAGVTIRSAFNYRRSQTQWGIMTLVHLGSNIYSLSGNLKQ